VIRAIFAHRLTCVVEVNRPVLPVHAELRLARRALELEEPAKDAEHQALKPRNRAHAHVGKTAKANTLADDCGDGLGLPLHIT
jgi:hypothetical protein